MTRLLVENQTTTWWKVFIALAAGSSVPVLAISILGWPYVRFVLAVGLPIALAGAYIIALPICLALLRWNKLTLGTALAVGAVTTAMPFIILNSTLMLRSALGWPATEGVISSASEGVWYVREGHLTPKGWFVEILQPVAFLMVLGAAGAFVAWRIAFCLQPART